MTREEAVAYFEERRNYNPHNGNPDAERLAIEALRDQWRDVFTQSTSGYLAGAGKRGWKASLGWLLTDANFQKVLAGEYRDLYGEKPMGYISATIEATERVAAGTAGLDESSREAIRRMMEEHERECKSENPVI